MQPDRTTLVGALKERSGEGRFWAGDLDSESEVEDLGDAEGRPDLVRSTTLESIGQAGNPQDWQEVKKKTHEDGGNPTSASETLWQSVAMVGGGSTAASLMERVVAEASAVTAHDDRRHSPASGGQPS